MNKNTIGASGLCVTAKTNKRQPKIMKVINNWNQTSIALQSSTSSGGY